MQERLIRRNITKLGAVAALTTVLAGAGMGIAGATTPAQGPSGSTGSPGPGQGLGGRLHAPGGEVTAISASSVTVQDRSGDAKTFVIDSATVFVKAGVTVSSSDVSVGSHIRIVPTAKGSTTVSKIMVQGPHVGGKVTAVNGDTVSLTNRQGTNVTVVESSATTYTKNGAAASSSDVAVGQSIVAQGSFVSGSTTTLNATNVIVGIPGPGQMGPGHMGTNDGGSSPPAS